MPLYEAEQKRSSELRGLASLAQAIGASYDYGNLLQLSVVLFAVDAASFAWRRNDPGIIDNFSVGGIVYFLLVFLLMPLVIIIGWYGATLTFPLAKPEDKDRG